MNKSYISPLLLIGGTGGGTIVTNPSQEHTPGVPEQNANSANSVNGFFSEDDETYGF